MTWYVRSISDIVNFKLSGHMLLIILYIKIAFWYGSLSVNVCQLSSLNSSEDGVYKSQSKITHYSRVHAYWNL